MLVLPTLVLCAGAPTASAAQEQGSASSCVGCHDELARLEREAPHAHAGVLCVDCHGGDPEAEGLAAKAPGTGFRGVPDAASAVELCGTCHADVRRMNPYGLPTDQLAQYRTSRHGQALLEEGREGAASCVDCHGAHGVRGPTQASSPVHPTRVPATCARCHGDPERMEPVGLAPEVPADYRGSVHGRLLLERGDVSAPQCATCHGSHGAVPPGFGSVGAVCGKCHPREEELYAQSPHQALTEEDLFTPCSSCHGDHSVTRAAPALLEQPLCTLCHSAGDETLATRDRIVASLREGSAQLERAQETLEEAAGEGLVVPDDRLLLDRVRTDHQLSQVVQHTLSAERVEESVASVREGAHQLQRRLKAEREDQRRRRLAAVPAALFLALMSLGFYLRYRRIHGEDPA